MKAHEGQRRPTRAHNSGGYVSLLITIVLCIIRIEINYFFGVLQVCKPMYLLAADDLLCYRYLTR